MKLPRITAPNNALQALFNLLVQLWSSFFGDRMDPVALPAELADLRVEAGTRKWVSALRCNFVYDPSSALAADGITVIASTIAGRWLREEPAPDAWGKQPTWFVNPGAVGDDFATGIDAGHPIKTLAEWKRRVVSVRGDMKIKLMDDLPDTDPFPAHVEPTNAFKVFVEGTMIPTGESGQITAFAAANPAGNTPCKISKADGDWLACLGRFLYFPARAAWTMAAINLPAHEAYVSPPRTFASAEDIFSTDAVPQAGDDYVAYRPSIVFLPTAETYRGGVTYSGGRFGLVFSMVEVASVGFLNEVTASGGDIVFKLCHIARSYGLSLVGSFMLQSCLSGSLTEPYHRLDVTVSSLQATMSSCLILAAGDGNGGIEVLSCNNFRVPPGSGGLLFAGSGIRLSGGDTDWYDAICMMNCLGLTINNGASLKTQSGFVLYGSGNTNGLIICSGGRVARTDPSYFKLAATRELKVGNADDLMPNLLGAGGAVLPAAQPCTTWVQWSNPATFNGTAFNHNDGAYIGP